MNRTEWEKTLTEFRTYLETDRALATITIRNYLIDIEHLYPFMLKNKLLKFSDFDRSLIRKYLSWLIELGYVRRSVTRKLSTLRVFLSLGKNVLYAIINNNLFVCPYIID